MANNRMYLVNRRTGTRIYLAKYYPSTGWYTRESIRDDLDAGFEEADFGHLTEEMQKANDAHLGLGVPFPSPAGMYGDEWALEYEDTTDQQSGAQHE